MRCSQDWLSLFEICTSSLLGEQKSCSAARPPVVTRKLAPWTLLLFLCFPSVHLSGRRQTTALRRRWMEVVNGPETKKKKKKRVSRTESERDVWQRTSPQTEWQMRGLWSRDIFPQWSKLGSLPARLRSQLLTLVDRVKIQGAGNILHFNVIFHSIDRNSLLTWLYC